MKALGYAAVSSPVTPTSGPNAGGLLVYLLDPDGNPWKDASCAQKCPQVLADTVHAASNFTGSASVPKAGMKAMRGEFADGAVDDYLLQLWLAPWKPDAILRTGTPGTGTSRSATIVECAIRCLGSWAPRFTGASPNVLLPGDLRTKARPGNRSS